MKTYHIMTFGCQMNYADTEKLHMILSTEGYTHTFNIKESDLVIFNTCSIRQKGEDRVYGYLRNIHTYCQKHNKKIIIGITGCMVKKTGIHEHYMQGYTRKKISTLTYLRSFEEIYNCDDPLFRKISFLDFTLRIEEIKYLSAILHIIQNKTIPSISGAEYFDQKQKRDSFVSAKVIIQTGCDNFCTFCVVPYTRGREQSRKKEEILEEIQSLAHMGVKEIILLGQNVNSYGKQEYSAFWNTEQSQWKTNLPLSPFRNLLNEISTLGSIKRIQFTSSNPHDMTQDILDAHFELPICYRSLHFALQSGSNEMLAKMNRKHTYQEFKEKVLYLREKDPLFTITTDIIVGFCGETEEMFEDTLKALKELEIDFAYIARYSHRPGTLAYKLYKDDIDYSTKTLRFHKANAIIEHNIKKRATLMIGNITEVLITGEHATDLIGKTHNGKEIFFEKTKNFHPGDIVPVKVTGMKGWTLRGEIV